MNDETSGISTGIGVDSGSNNDMSLNDSHAKDRLGEVSDDIFYRNRINAEHPSSLFGLLLEHNALLGNETFKAQLHDEIQHMKMMQETAYVQNEEQCAYEPDP